MVKYVLVAPVSRRHHVQESRLDLTHSSRPAGRKGDSSHFEHPGGLIGTASEAISHDGQPNLPGWWPDRCEGRDAFAPTSTFLTTSEPSIQVPDDVARALSWSAGLRHVLPRRSYGLPIHGQVEMGVEVGGGPLRPIVAPFFDSISPPPSVSSVTPFGILVAPEGGRNGNECYLR